jgi:hypothetical protein
MIDFTRHEVISMFDSTLPQTPKDPNKLKSKQTKSNWPTSLDLLR